MSAQGMSAQPADVGVPPAPAPRPAANSEPRRKKRNRLPYLLLAPTLLWLIVFFIVPIFTSVSASVQEGSLDEGFTLTWRWANYADGWSQYATQFGRSFLFAFLCTVFCLLLGYPLAYFIAFKAGRWKSLLMALVIVPSFTSFLIRTIAWETILSDNGTVVRILRDVGALNVTSALGLTASDHVLASPGAVVFGMVYNFLPFTVLPLYTSLEKIDPRLHEAGADLYCSPWKTWRRVTLPLSMPGVVGGTLLTFIPAVGDYINAQLLGNPNTKVIGQIIEDEFLHDSTGYPIASAMSVILMAVTLIVVLSYVRKAGTEDLL
ncbi:MAG TPA: ABC transporter permease [Actinocrinis sp.]|nr:ABC transporter permease [Actinocrinis sp.]